MATADFRCSFHISHDIFGFCDFPGKHKIPSWARSCTGNKRKTKYSRNIFATLTIKFFPPRKFAFPVANSMLWSYICWIHVKGLQSSFSLNLLCSFWFGATIRPNCRQPKEERFDASGHCFRNTGRTTHDTRSKQNATLFSISNNDGASFRLLCALSMLHAHKISGSYFSATNFGSYTNWKQVSSFPIRGLPPLCVHITHPLKTKQRCFMWTGEQWKTILHT